LAPITASLWQARGYFRSPAQVWLIEIFITNIFLSVEEREREAHTFEICNFRGEGQADQ
jgi:hypothetical protein